MHFHLQFFKRFYIFLLRSQFLNLLETLFRGILCINTIEIFRLVFIAHLAKIQTFDAR